jgi:hypothetical protein
MGNESYIITNEYLFRGESGFCKIICVLGYIHDRTDQCEQQDRKKECP